MAARGVMRSTQKKQNPVASYAAAALLLVVLCSGSALQAAWASKKYTLKYYVHIELNGALGASDKFLPALNPRLSFDFGAGSLFALNVTKELSRTSRQLGYSRGYTVETSYVSGVDKAVETAVLEYADDTHNGTFTVVGIVGNSGANEVAIVGGTGTFRGARGYIIISFAASYNNLTVFSFAHEAHFI